MAANASCLHDAFDIALPRNFGPSGIVGDPGGRESADDECLQGPAGLVASCAERLELTAALGGCWRGRLDRAEEDSEIALHPPTSDRPTSRRSWDPGLICWRRSYRHQAVETIFEPFGTCSGSLNT